jgi:hypothetical protein
VSNSLRTWALNITTEKVNAARYSSIRNDYAL